MICNKCHNSAVVNRANGKDFYFCQTCRLEVGLDDKPDFSSIKSYDDISDFYKEWKQAEDEPGTVGYDVDGNADDDQDDWYSAAPYNTPQTLTQEEIDKMFSDLEQESTDRD